MDVRGQIRSFLDEEWDPELPLGEWRERLVVAGWACPGWPVEWHGRGLSATDASLAVAELATAGVPGPPAGVGLGLAGHLSQRPYLDAGAVHVDDERGEPGVLHGLRIGSHDEQSPP